MSLSFSIARLPRIEFGAGCLSRLPAIAAGLGRRVLLVTGGRSLERHPAWPRLQAGLEDAGLQIQRLRIEGEPSPQQVDAAVRDFAGADIELVIGIGGGSVLDGAKAIAGLLRVGRSVMDYLEGVGPELDYQGPAVPFIAVPTTAGTGSEATKNAVLSVIGEQGFKKSFRDERLVPAWAVVDPELLAGCPPALIAANGMDALTQLMESYVSLRANPMTDALAVSGLRALRGALLTWYEQGAAAREAQAAMAYAALQSGITLAQTGLGSVHGLASPLGAFFPIPHGVACGTLLATATAVNIRALSERQPDAPALARYARLGEILSARRIREPEVAREALLKRLEDWTRRLDLPRLSAYGVKEENIPRIVAHSRGSSMRTNPVELSDAEIAAILQARL
ncbi:iron-containing alcohol dehydrogenase [Thiohalobacter sp. IOR34]|uniref:iron-containing alcohol dehydrogenase n=1 Tax=Thiohalobacter sp. IOR34 TaxID=3057176 RepID=UPI0025B20B4E|nr:iron-containing alcohol dehydrogenase [Thiohalobacter sp. IOR34]WJW76331.1 iron-containing alcohol dehydrogenase [Thiohalobacter sp. IOR34]